MSRLITDVGLAPLTVSLTASSFLLFGTGMLEFVGPVMIIRDKLAPLNLSKRDRVRIFAAYFRAIAPLVVGSAVLTSLTSGYTAYKTINPKIASAAWTAAISAISIIPYTLLAIQPINHTLLGLADKAAKEELTIEEEDTVVKSVEKWSLLHLPRFIGYSLAWGGSLLAFARTAESFRV